MRVRRASVLIFSVGIVAASAAAPVIAASVSAEIAAGPPIDLIVTVYRAPYRDSGSIDLDYLGGFALVSETRLVHLPAGVSRVRFEGVADGIEPASAIVSGLPGTVIEKNRDARLLSPSTLIAAAVGKPTELLRTNRKTGKTEALPGTILSDAGGGVLFQTEQGIEALRCSGLPETFSFAPAADLSARPTLSVEVKSANAVTKEVTLSYLSRGFDWSADYKATLSADGQSLNLGAWVTLANSNGVGFEAAHTQVVAGKVNRENGEVLPIDLGGAILAQCWPRGSTSDRPMVLRRAEPGEQAFFKRSALAAEAPAAATVVVTAQKVQQEQLGDLKLYRVPERTTLASRQSKQVRLMDRLNVPVRTLYGADLAPADQDSSSPAHRLLRTRNNAANHLGLALPSGKVGVFSAYDGSDMLQRESNLRDTAVDEEVEIDLGWSADVQVSVSREKTSIDSAHAVLLPRVPGTVLRSVKIEDTQRVDISNAGPKQIDFELRLRLPDGAEVVGASQPPGAKNGRPVFLIQVPANQTVTLRYQWQRSFERILRTP